MAQKFYSKYTAQEIENILKDADAAPFIIYYDEDAGVYRFFKNEERRDAWIKASLDGTMTEEIMKYQFTDPFTAPAPYTIEINGLTDNQYCLYGQSNNFVEFNFLTVDGQGKEIHESVEVYYTIKTSAGSKTTSNIYDYGSTARLNLDDYLALGTNVISILVRGRTTSTLRTVVVTYYVVELSLTSDFNFYTPLERGNNLDVPYVVKGQTDKQVDFYIDGTLFTSASVSISNGPEYIGIQTLNTSNLSPGIHTLQLKASMRISSDKQFFSNLLYYEFIIPDIEDEDQIAVLVSEVFSPNHSHFVGQYPGFLAEQYVSKNIQWAYYSTNRSFSSATITWKLRKEGEEKTTVISTRNVESESPLSPLIFMPTETGNFDLLAYISKNDTEEEITTDHEYSITIIPNTNNLFEKTDGLQLKLSGIGRENSEPDESREIWSYYNLSRNFTYTTTFYNQPWNDNSGWKDGALILNNGATAHINDFKPFQSNNIDLGYTVEIDFETFNSVDDDCILFKIGDVSRGDRSIGAELVIKPSSAYLKSRNGTTISTKFKSDERVKLAFVVNPIGNNNSAYFFIYVNGVLSAAEVYDKSDSFVNTSSEIDLGNSIVEINNRETSICGTPSQSSHYLGKCNAGIKIYYIRSYNVAINRFDELTNFIIDSGSNISKLVSKNDIYNDSREIDVNKLEGSITTVKITGPLDLLINKKEKTTIYGGLEITSPNDPAINMHCSGAQFKNAGQSTLDKPIPSLHVKLDKEGNVCYDRDEKKLVGNRWAFREGNVPEKKFRLQANYMDSSCAHNGAFLRLFNEVSPRVRVNGNYVLRTPAEQYAYEEYSEAMTAIHGEDPRGLNWKFPYTLHMVPDSIPCIVVWREDSESPYQFLGQYVIMEEKKSNFTNGMRSIYDTIDSDGNPDPFQFKVKGGNRLWDNENCYQMELLTSVDDMTLFLDDVDWDAEDSDGNKIREKQFELVYPDEDDILKEGGTTLLYETWNKFYTKFLHPVCSTKGTIKYHDSIETITGNQLDFNNLYYGENSIMDRWHFAAYYCLFLRNCCSDSLARNMELTTYDGQHWLPKWWDVDMQCGLYQTGACNLEPMSTRNTVAPGTESSFALSGRGLISTSGKIRSSWLWDGLERCEQFIQDVKTIDNALYDAGWTYTRMNELMDEGYVNTWSQALYNESGIYKYIDHNTSQNNVKIHLQGDRTPHRHWFLRTSYDYFDAINVCGEYTDKTIDVRTEIPYSPQDDVVCKIRLTTGIDSFLGWGTSISKDFTGLEAPRGVEKELTIDRTLQLNNPLHVYAASKLSEVDFSEIAPYMAADLNLSKTYDSVTGTYLRKVILGVSMQNMHNNIFNRFSTLSGVSGIENFTRVEEFNIQGLYNIITLDLTNMRSLKKFYAAGTRLNSFIPASGSNLEDIQLPTTISSIKMNSCTLQNDIKWYKTTTGTSENVENYYILAKLSPDSNDIGWRKMTDSEIFEIDSTTTVIEIESLSDLPNIEDSTIGDIVHFITIKYLMDIDEDCGVDINTLKSISLEGMGSDRKAQNLVISWINEIENYAHSQGNDSIYNQYQLIYKGLRGNRNNSSDTIDVFNIETLKRIGKIPKSQRTLQGYIVARGSGPNGSFTAEELNILINDFGPDIFTLGSSFCIDCIYGDIVVSAIGEDTIINDNGVIEILKGTKAVLKGSGFPLGKGKDTYFWSIYDSDTGNLLFGNQSSPWVTVKSIHLNSFTGEIEAYENSINDSSFTYLIRSSRVNSEGDTIASGNIDLVTISRTYPENVEIRLNGDDSSSGISEINPGAYQIKSIGTYIFDAIFNIDFNGNFDNNSGGGEWTVDGFDSLYMSREDSDYSEGKNSNNEYKLVIGSMPPDDEISVRLKYTAHWMNSSTTVASPVSVTLANVIPVLYQDTIFGNPSLFNIVNNIIGAPDNSAYYTSLELKTVNPSNSTINFKDILDGLHEPINGFKHLYSGKNDMDPYKYNITKYLINVKVLNLTGCSGLNKDVDISTGSNNFDKLLMRGSNVNAIIGEDSNLKLLELGSPTRVEIKNPVYLKSTDISIENKSNIGTLILENLKDNKTFEKAAELISNSITVVSIQQTSEETVNSNVIDKLASVVDNLDSSIHQNLNGILYSEYLYESSYNKLKIPLSKFPDLIIQYTVFYIPFVDIAFRNYLAQKFGDGFGILNSHINTITKLEELQYNEEIVDLSDMDKLTSLTFNTNNSENDSPFKGCTNLTSIKFPSNITKIGSYTFNGNNNLTTVDLSDCTYLTQIEENAFYNITSDKKLIINLSSCTYLNNADLRSISNPDSIIVEYNSSGFTLKI